MKVHSSVEIIIALRIGSTWHWRDVDKCFGIWTSLCNICSYTRHSRPISESHPTYILAPAHRWRRGGGCLFTKQCLVTCFLSCIRCFYQIYPCYSSCLGHMIHPQFHTKGELCCCGENTGNIHVKIILW